MLIGFDFDGTLAVWPRGVRIDYDNPQWAMAQAAAVLGTIRWMKAVIKRGHDVVVITGRGAIHQGPLRYWLFQFTGHFIDVVTRPTAVGLNSAEQAAWKAKVVRELGVCMYVGDNHRIDKAAAKIAGVRFLDAKTFRNGTLPALPMILANSRRGA